MEGEILSCLVMSGRKIHGGQCLTKNLEALSVLSVEGDGDQSIHKVTSILLIVLQKPINIDHQ